MTKQDVLLHETTEQIRAKASLEDWVEIFLTAFGRRRRDAAKRIREMAAIYPWLGDLLSDDVWNQVYLVNDTVRATGTIAPFALVPENDNDGEGE